MYYTEDSLQYYDFSESILDEIEVNGLDLFLYMENVKILPENPNNRDIRLMRTNDFILKLCGGQITSLTKDGFKRYDANGVLQQTVGDEPVEAGQIPATLPSLQGMEVDTVTREDDTLTMELIGEEDSYTIRFRVQKTREEWNRFLNL